MPRKRSFFIHCNSDWIDLIGSGDDEYGRSGELHPVTLPCDFSLQDIKKRAMRIENFLDGPDFDVYGLMWVPNMERKQRIKITSNDTLRIYVQETRGMTSFFTVKSKSNYDVNQGSENRRNPVTPPNADQHARHGGAGVTSPLTPPQMNSSEDGDCHQGTKRVPLAKRRIITEELGTPGSKRLRSLHDAPCTPEPEDDDTTPLPPARKMRFDELCVNNTFRTKQVLEIVLEVAKVKERFNWRTAKSDRKRLVVDCKDPSCRWRLRAAKVGNLPYFIIKSIRAPHTCDRNKLLIKIESASRGLAELFKKKFSLCHSIYTPRQLQYDLEHTYKVEVTYRQAFKGCKRGIEQIRGSIDESYQHLVGYCHMLADRNQGSLTAIQTDKDDVFEYCFVALGVCLEGFKRHARLAFAVDGTHLTGERLGLVLSAVALDANEQIYPIAFGIVDSENNKACAWFMEKLAAAFGDDFLKRKDLVIASDRSQPIRTAVENAFPDATHVFCAYHIKENIRKKYHNNEVAGLFWSAAQAFTEHEYKQAMAELRNLSPNAADEVRDIGPHKWARVYANGARYSLMTTNACESWNAKILKVKDVPICHLVDFLRKTLMKWFSIRRQQSNDWDEDFSKHAHEAIEKRRILAVKCSVIHVIGEQYEISESDNQDQNLVNLDRMSCTCGVFTFEHLPCGHAMAVCQKIGVRWETLCGEYYRTSSWRGMYAPPIYGVLTCDWDLPEDVGATVVLNPNTGRGPGRPRGGRFRSANERPAPSKGTRSCSNCHKRGHYASTCPDK